MRKNKCVGIIPARAGSKGVPGKNLKLLAGRPLISYTIEAAIKASSLDRVIVSTEDKEIAHVAARYGAEVPFLRPKKLSHGDVPTWPVVKHAIDYMEKKEGYFPEVIATLWCTAPLRKAEHIDSAIKELVRTKADAIIGVCRIESKHPYLAKKIKNKKVSPLINSRLSAAQRQDLPEVYMMNGAFTIRKRHVYEWLKKGVTEYKKEKTVAYIMDPVSSIDINTKLDFILAEAVLERGLTKKKMRIKEKCLTDNRNNLL